MSYINLKNISFSYGESKRKAIDHINLKINQGEVVLLCGASGCGKSTLLQVINGILPEQRAGVLDGEILISNINALGQSVKEKSKLIGSVFQNPKSQFFHLNTTDELFFAAANHLVDLTEMERRLLEITSNFKIKDLINRNIFMLSGGEKQKIACASVAMNYPKIYLLDEPSSNLDQKSIEELKEILSVLKKQGSTIIVAEHRLYYILEICDKVCYMKDGKIINEYNKDLFMQINEDIRKKMGLRSFIKINKPLISNEIENNNNNIIIENMKVNYGQINAVNIQKLIMPKNKIIAIIGNNGAGKSSFVNAFCGLIKTKDTYINGHKLKIKEQQKNSFMVMQDVNSQLYCESVIDELIHLIDENDENIFKARNVLEKLNLLSYEQEHPMILSGGQKQRLAIATALFLEKKYLIFDEPTSGLDYDNMIRVASVLNELKTKVDLILVITHDMELIQNCAEYIIEMKGKENES